MSEEPNYDPASPAPLNRCGLPLFSPIGSCSSTHNKRQRRSNIPSLVAALSASLTTGGTTYAFGLYGNDLKRSLDLTAGEVDTISTAFFVAGIFSWIPGLAADKCGTKVSIATGGVTGAISLITYWCVAKQYLVVEDRSNLVPVLCTLGIAIFLSCAMITGSVFKIIVSCCGPGSKGNAVGAAKGLVGLGSGVYASIFQAIRQPPSSGNNNHSSGQSNLDFLLMAAFFALVSATLPALLLLPNKSQVDSDLVVGGFRDDTTPQHFRILFGALGVLAVLVIGSSLAELSKHQSHADNGPSVDDEGRHWFQALLLVGTWLGPIACLLLLPKRRPDESDDDLVLLHDSDAEETMLVEEDYLLHRPVQLEAEEMLLDDLSLRSSGSLDRSRRSSSGISLKRVSGAGSSISPSRRRDVSDREEDDDELISSEVVEGRSLLLGPRDARSSMPGAASPTNRAVATASLSTDQGDLDDEERNLLQLLQTPSAWLMLWTTTILVGAGTVVTNNMGEMVEALHLPSAVTASSLALFSVAQAAGRVATGAVSESALNWTTKRFLIDNGIPRPFFLVIASCLGALAHLILGLATRQLFFVLGSTLAGAAFGMVWPLMVLIVGEVFGTSHAGANYMFYDGFSSAIGTLLFTKLLAQRVYEMHLIHNGEDSGEGGNSSTCFGSACFQITHLVVSLLSLTCILSSYGLLFTSRHTYNRRRFHRA